MNWQIVVRASVVIKADNRSLNTVEDVKPIVDAIKKCKPLRELCLEGYSYGVAAAECIGEALAECGSELRIALWSDMFVSRTKEEVPVALASLMDGLIKSGAQLKLLDLSNNAFGAQGVQSLVAYFKSDLAVNLEDLFLTNTGLGIGGAKVLASALDRLTNLKALKIGRNRLENEGSIALAGVLKKFSKLEALEMPQNGIYFKGFEALAQVLEANPNIEELNFSDNTIGPKGSKALKQVLPKLVSLSCLYLDDCLLKNQGAKYILEALLPPNNDALTVLNLSANEISDKITEQLLKDAIFWRSTLQCDLFENRLSKLFRDQLLTNEDMLCELSFGDEKELDDYYDDDDDDDDDDEEGEEEEEEDYDDDDDDEEDLDDAKYMEHEDLSSDEEQAINLSYIPTTVNKEDDLPCKEFDDVLVFLKETNKENFSKLGSNPTEALIKRLQSIKDEEEYTDELVKMIFKMNIVEQDPKEIFSNMNLWEKDDEHRSSVLANCFLVHLGVMKSEDKKKVLCGNAEQCLKSFSKSLNSSDFSPKLRDTIMFVVKDKCAREKKIGCIDSERFLELLSNDKN